MTADFNDDDARTLRRAWFSFLDLLEPLRPELHRFCLRLTGNVWSAEDLCQDALLRGFGALGRGDLHGEASKLRNARAYLFRVAANLWIDEARRAHRESAMTPLDGAAALPDAETLASIRDAGEALFDQVGPQERAAVVLKDTFDFTLAETAELLSTSVGAVKAALHRGRSKLQAGRAPPPRGSGPSAALIDRFVAAFRNHDAAAIRDVLLETVSIEVQGVGGGRGRNVDWADHAAANASPRVEAREYLGELIVLHMTARGRLVAVTRLEETEAHASRVFTYLFTPDSLATVAADLGLEYVRGPYHQSAETLVGMIATTALPWETTLPR